MHEEEFGEDGKNGGATGGGKRPTGINSSEMTKDQLGKCEIRQGIAREFVRATGIGKAREVLRSGSSGNSGLRDEGEEIGPKGERDRMREGEAGWQRG